MSLLKRISSGGQDQEGDKPGDASASKLSELRVKRQTVANTSATTSSEGGYADLKVRVQNKLLSEIDPTMDVSRTAEVRSQIEELFNAILSDEGIVLARNERRRLFEQVVADILGLGPLEPLLADDSITEIMVNGPKSVYIERKGRLVHTDVTFENDEHAMRILDRIVAPLGRRIDESQPTVDARLADGSRVNAVIKPISLNGTTITIRKFSKNPLTIEDLIRFGTITREVVDFLRACVIARTNIVVSGGTGSGKTTLLNVLSSFIPDDERIVTIENAAELQLRQDHVVTLESRPPNIEGKGQITIQDLVVNSLRMRPDRIVVGECRSGEALDMLQAMNTGHDGSLTTAHSNSPRDTLARLEVMCLMSGMDLPVRAIREQVASAIDLIVHQERLRDGSRKVTKVTEVQGMEGDVITMSDIFEFEQTGFEQGKVIGRVRPTGLRPKFMDQIEAAGIHLPPAVFGIGAGRY
jgi:pilus assembly protein CpaF